MNIFKRKAIAGLAGLAALLFALPIALAGVGPGNGYSPGGDDVTTSPIVADSSPDIRHRCHNRHDSKNLRATAPTGAPDPPPPARSGRSPIERPAHRR